MSGNADIVSESGAYYLERILYSHKFVSDFTVKSLPMYNVAWAQFHETLDVVQVFVQSLSVLTIGHNLNCFNWLVVFESTHSDALTIQITL